MLGSYTSKTKIIMTHLVQPFSVNNKAMNIFFITYHDIDIDINWFY